jgi:aerobic C4-dicarboxylate transport protein
MSSTTIEEEPRPQTDTPARRSLWGRLIRELWFHVIVGAVLGIAVGLLFPTVGAALTPLSDWFIALVKMIVIPVVFCVVSLGIASMDSLRKAGRVGVKALSYFIVLSLLSMLIGLVAANTFKPGEGLNIDPSTLNAGAVPVDEHDSPGSLVEFVSSTIPESFFGALTGHTILAALLVSILFGSALNLDPPTRVAGSSRA